MRVDDARQHMQIGGIEHLRRIAEPGADRGDAPAGYADIRLHLPPGKNHGAVPQQKIKIHIYPPRFET